jgi:hypothetical protein
VLAAVDELNFMKIAWFRVFFGLTRAAARRHDT